MIALLCFFQPFFTSERARAHPRMSSLSKYGSVQYSTCLPTGRARRGLRACTTRVILHESATHGHKRGARFPGVLLRHFTDSLRKQTKWRELFGTVDHLSVVLHGRPLKGLDSLCIQTVNGAIAERRHRGCLPRLGMYHSDYRQRP